MTPETHTFDAGATNDTLDGLRYAPEPVAVPEAVCACGCGVVLTPVQVRRKRQYASRSCVGRRNGRQVLHRPDVMAKRAAVLAVKRADPQWRAAVSAKQRKAKARERLAHWWAGAHLDRVMARITRTIELEPDDQRKLSVLLAQAMQAHYWRAYRAGWQTAKRRVRDEQAVSA